jgi:branched-chain amino acid transport system permease protein
VLKASGCASGLTLIFGLMDVLNFGHGTYLALTVLGPLSDWISVDNPLMSLSALAAMLGAALLGWAFKRLVILPVYGHHLKQILITTGGLIVAEEAVKPVWGGEQKR